MVKKYIKIILILISVFILSCSSDKKSELLTEHLQEKFSISFKDEIVRFLVYSEPGCISCNREMINYLNSNQKINNIYLIYKSAYPNQDIYQELNDKYNECLLWDRTDYLDKIGLNLNGSGKIIVKNGKIVEISTFAPTEIDIKDFIDDMVKFK